MNELEQPLGKSVDMLQCTLTVSQQQITVLHRNKNADSLLQYGRQKYKKFTDFSSAHPMSVKMGVVYRHFHACTAEYF